MCMPGFQLPPPSPSMLVASLLVRSTASNLKLLPEYRYWCRFKASALHTHCQTSGARFLAASSQVWALYSIPINPRCDEDYHSKQSRNASGSSSNCSSKSSSLLSDPRLSDLLQAAAPSFPVTNRIPQSIEQLRYALYHLSKLRRQQWSRCYTGCGSELTAD